jgi:beta-N-acetylhexosaminidase
LGCLGCTKASGVPLVRCPNPHLVMGKAPLLCLIALVLCTACSQGALSRTPSAAGTPSPTLPHSTPPAKDTPRSTSQPAPIVPPQEARVEEILLHMTIKEKVGQLFAVHFNETYFSPALEEMIVEYHVGGIIIFPHNLTTLTELATLISDAQQAAVDGEPGIPFFVAADQEGWPVLRLPEGGTIFPSNMAVGATDSVEDAQLMASVMASEMKAVGFNMNLAPVMDVNSNPQNPVIGTRSFGSSPELVSRLGTAMIEAYQSQGILATAKHFPGHGDTSVDSHYDLPVIDHDRARLEAVELVPFQAAISAGVECIMTAHVSVPALDPVVGRPATLSPDILQGLLREKMGFQGLIATDSLSMSALMNQYDLSTATALAFEAGADLLMFGYTPRYPPDLQLPAYDTVLRMVEEGAIPESRLDDAVRRILLTKARHGLLDWQPEPLDLALKRVGTESNQAAARQVALDSITLVRDEDALLPLSSDSPILVIYPRGGAAFGQAVLQHSPRATLLEVSERPTSRDFVQATTQAGAAHLVLIGTRDVMENPEQAALVEALRVDYPVIAVALDSPYDLLSYPQVSTYLATYGRAPVSMEALGQVLFGYAKPTGRLPVELPGLYEVGHRSTSER